MSDMRAVKGNVLGGPRAEVDAHMLETAFVETNDFKALTSTTDFNFIVGRRGTGKTALYMKVSEHIANNKLGHVYKSTPQEYEQMAIQATVAKLGAEYRIIRAITRVAWRASILLDQAEHLSTHYKLGGSEEHKFLLATKERFKDFTGMNLFKKTARIIERCGEGAHSPDEIPGSIAIMFDIETMQSLVDDLLLQTGKPAYYIFDGLDEGWQPGEQATAVLGGLASCAADILDKQSELHMLLFIRDNIFRSLSYFDKDFSRHIEGNTLRLTWDEASLLHLIANRLRASFGYDDIESNVKVWNRFARGRLKNLAGFKTCLNYTLYRPRDIIVLLNATYSHIARGGRQDIVDSDIEVSSRQISKDRLSDLLKEYDRVFPGLSLLVNVFKGKEAFKSYLEVVAMLDEEIEDNEYLSEEASDYAMIGSGKEALFALYSVGFIGLENPNTRALQFCHDGSSADLDASQPGQRTCVHPCYWKALSIQAEIMEEDVLIDVYDDNDARSTEDIADWRKRRIGKIVSSLPRMAEGIECAANFEEWVLQAIQILFSGKLSNAEMKPNGEAVQRRDIVATNSAESGFWARIRQEYDASQVVFEVKNFSVLKMDNYRQALSYSGSQYGNFVVIVSRNKNEGLSEIEKGWVKEFWFQHKVIIFSLPATVLSRCISKLRTSTRFDYTEKLLNRRLDTYMRSYLAIAHSSGKRRRGKRKNK